jgi:hypothetical protein
MIRKKISRMPKERFHLLLTDLYLSRKSTAHAGRLRGESLAVSIGAISPDIFFYDLPSFSLSSLGDSLHDLMASQGMDPILNWFGNPPAAHGNRLWATGFACHFLADSIWHPIIDDLSASLEFCRRQGLGTRDCHRFLECEMEGLWLPEMGRPGGYIDLLDAFRMDRAWLAGIASIYRQFLTYAGLKAPSEGRIVRCFLNQNFMLRLFAGRLLGKKRDLLLSLPPTRYLGSLVVPASPALPFSSLPEDRPVLKLFSYDFMQRQLISLFALLSDFERRLSLSLPS